MRENRPSGSEGGVMQSNASSLPLCDPERAGANGERNYQDEHAAPLGLAIHPHIGSINMPRRWR